MLCSSNLLQSVPWSGFFVFLTRENCFSQPKIRFFWSEITAFATCFLIGNADDSFTLLSQFVFPCHCTAPCPCSYCPSSLHYHFYGCFPCSLLQFVGMLCCFWLSSLSESDHWVPSSPQTRSGAIFMQMSCKSLCQPGVCLPLFRRVFHLASPALLAWQLVITKAKQSSVSALKNSHFLSHLQHVTIHSQWCLLSRHVRLWILLLEL